MLALLAAATVAVLPRAQLEPVAMPNLYQTPAHCRNAPQAVVDRYGRPLLDRLGDLPRPGAMLLVERKINGCQVITMMRGLAPPRDDPNPATSQHRFMPLKIEVR